MSIHLLRYLRLKLKLASKVMAGFLASVLVAGLLVTNSSVAFAGNGKASSGFRMFIASDTQLHRTREDFAIEHPEMGTDSISDLMSQGYTVHEALREVGEQDKYTECHDCNDSQASKDNKNHVKSMINFMKNNKEYPYKGLIINGDLTESGYKKELNEFKMTYGVSGAFLGTHFYGLGNHDYHDTSRMTGFMWEHLMDLLHKGVNLSYDPNSQAYSWDINNVHFVQLHNYPGYNPDGVLAASSSSSWLEDDLQIADAQRKAIVLNLHDGEGSNNVNYISGLVNKYRISAVFIGHLHNRAGEWDFANSKSKIYDYRTKKSTGWDRNNAAWAIYSGSAITPHQRYLVVEFGTSKMYYKVVNSATGGEQATWTSMEYRQYL